MDLTNNKCALELRAVIGGSFLNGNDKSAPKKMAWYKDVDVYFQANAWAVTIEWVKNTYYLLKVV